MRTLTVAFICSLSLVAGTPALASGDGGVFVDGAELQVAHEGKKSHRHDDDRMTREEIEEEERDLRERKRELREEERDLREQKREREARKPQTPRIWVGVGTGVGFASVDVPCSSGFFYSDCTENWEPRTYSANITFTGAHTALRVRGIRAQDEGNDARTPYETAVLVGSRFGRSNWYGLAGVGRILHADDQYTKGDVHGFAWEIVFAPSSSGATGLELSFQGNSSSDVDFVGFNLGFRLGALH